MSPSEFVVRMSAADERFARALGRDDIREMRAALAEKTELLENYFTAPRRGIDKNVVQPADPQASDALASLPVRPAVSAALGRPGSPADAC